MTELPDEFPLPREAFERQRSLLGAHLETGPPPARLTRRRLAAVAAVILAGGLLVTPALGIGDRLFGLFESDPGPPGGRTPVWSPDGKKIAYLARRRPGTWDLYVMNADGGGRRRLMPDVRLRTLAWSPDGRNIAVASPGQAGGPDTIGLYLVNPNGSGRQQLSRSGEAPAWSPDGRRIAFAGRRGIWVVNADGSGRRRLTQQGVGRYAPLAWSPDGRKIAFLTEGHCGDFCFHLYVMNADGSNVRDLTPRLRGGPGQGVVDLAWSPDGRTIAFARFADAGDLVVRSTEAIFVVKPDGSGLRRLTWERWSAYRAPAWSPDGRRLAVVADRDGNSEVYVMNADGSRRRNVTVNPAYDGDPTWSPDGRRIAFVSNRDGVYGVYVMNADGSGQRALTQRD
jgi:Tol biopolymer transport system component